MLPRVFDGPAWDVYTGPMLSADTDGRRRVGWSAFTVFALASTGSDTGIGIRRGVRWLKGRQPQALFGVVVPLPGLGG